jgi:hypothetical protein
VVVVVVVVLIMVLRVSIEPCTISQRVFSHIIYMV